MFLLETMLMNVDSLAWTNSKRYLKKLFSIWSSFVEFDFVLITVISSVNFKILRLISEVTKRISSKLGHIFNYDCYLENFVRTPRAFTPHGLGAKPLFGDRFWTLTAEHISATNMISTIGKKLLNVKAIPYIHVTFSELWSRNSWDRLASFCLPGQNYRMDVI